LTRNPENQGIYTGFARGYDRIMEDVDFDAWAVHILELAEVHHLPTREILNLACGTGAAEPAWKRSGCVVTGVDQSEEMISIAREKNGDPEGERFLVGDMRRIQLGREFDLVCCLYDSLNYLTEPEDVLDCFSVAYDHLYPGGGFIFDVATEANILDNFSSTTYAENKEDFAYIWDNEYNLRTKICRSDFAFFYLDPRTGQFVRRCETHYQRMYTTRELSRWVKQAGLQLLGSYDGFTRRPPGSKSDRIHFVARKP
jgi:SAM-dependent methyltransferase